MTVSSATVEQELAPTGVKLSCKQAVPRQYDRYMTCNIEPTFNLSLSTETIIIASP